jgi:osmotically-inducible protein OsmY
MSTTYQSDESLKVDVVEQLYWDERFDANDISVRVEDGTVTLEGSVPTYFARHQVPDSVKTVKGVHDVNNQLSVDETAKEPTLKDEEILSRVQQTLSWDTAIDSTQVQTEVRNGTVILSGTVDQVWKRHRAETEVSELEGVLGVTNEITVVPTEDIEDRMLAQDLVQAFERNPYVDPNDLDVTVEDQVVFVGGTVSSPQARREASDIVRKSAGVKRVENNVQVGSEPSEENYE